MPADRIAIEKSPGYYRRGGRVEFRFTDKHGRRRWRAARNVTEAKALRAQLTADVARGELRELSRVTVPDYARSWITTYRGRTSTPIREHSRKNLERRLEDAYEFFGEMRMAEVEPQDVKAFAAWVAGRKRRGVRYKADLRPLSANTVRLTLAPVKAMFATAFEEGVIRVNPAAGIRLAVPQQRVSTDEDDAGDVKALTGPELTAVLTAIAATAPEWLLFFRVLVSLGLRFSEISELRWRDVDLGARTVKIRRVAYEGRVGPPKSKYGRRTLRLAPELAQALWRVKGKGKPDDLIFANLAGSRVDGSNLMARVLKPAAVAAGIGSMRETPKGPRAESWVGFHTFRHTCATLLFTVEKWNPKQVQVWLGHHSAAFTVQVYVHLLPEDLPEPPALGGTVFGTESGTTVPVDPRKSAVAGPVLEPGAISGFPAATESGGDLPAAVPAFF